MRGRPLYFLSLEIWTNLGSRPLHALHQGAKNLRIMILSGCFARSALYVYVFVYSMCIVFVWNCKSKDERRSSVSVREMN